MVVCNLYGQEDRHFLPPGVAHTTGYPHNPFTWRPLKDGKKTLTPKCSAMKSYVK